LSLRGRGAVAPKTDAVPPKSSTSRHPAHASKRVVVEGSLEGGVKRLAAFFKEAAKEAAKQRAQSEASLRKSGFSKALTSKSAARPPPTHERTLGFLLGTPSDSNETLDRFFIPFVLSLQIALPG
jgi:hypothetical protein